MIGYSAVYIDYRDKKCVIYCTRARISCTHSLATPLFFFYSSMGDALFFFTRLNTCFWIQLYYTHLLQTSTRRHSMSIISTHINLFYMYRYLLNKVIHWRIIHCKRLCFKCDLRHNTFCTNIQNCWRVLYHMHNLLYSEILK